MAKRQPRFVCQECGTVTNRWAGKCESCGAWNSISEETVTDPILAGTGKLSSVRGRPVKLESLAGTSDEPPRLQTGIAELDRVTGGGFVPGSVVVVAGVTFSPDTGLPFLAGLTIFAISMAIMGGVFTGVVWLNNRAVKQLDAEIAELDRAWSTVDA